MDEGRGFSLISVPQKFPTKKKKKYSTDLEKLEDFPKKIPSS